MSRHRGWQPISSPSWTPNAHQVAAREKSDGASGDRTSSRLSAVDRPFTVFLFLTVMVLTILGCGEQDNEPAGEIGPSRLPPLPPPVADSVSTPSSAAPSDAAAEILNLGPVVATIVYKDGAFTPKRLDIELGQTVAFANDSDKEFWPASNIHPTHEIYPELDAKGRVPSGGSWTFKFAEPGFWRYHNHMAPEDSGLVVVEGEKTSRRALRTPDEVDTDFAEPGPLSVQDSVNLFRDDALLKRYVREYGPANVVSLLAEQEKRISVDCHQRAHVMGRLAYEYFGALAFSLSGHECHSGGYHGATEAFFRDQGTANLHSDIALVCSGALNAFFQHQCVHGVGHGLMAWTSYELLDALELCDILNTGADQRSCYSGVFMENVVGGLSGSMGHITEYLSDDPHFPCNIVTGEYLTACYFYQTSRMVELFEGDFGLLANACTEAPDIARNACFLSMGRDIGGVTRGDSQRAIKLCSNSPGADDRLNCQEGAVQDSLWDLAGADNALAFCQALQSDSEKRRCYSVIVRRAAHLYNSPSDLQGFCARIKEAYRDECR